MRKNTKEAIRRWQDGRASIPSQHGSSIWSDGDSIWSYQTCIATRTAAGYVVLNGTKYSRTTTQHQAGIKLWLDQCHDAKWNTWQGLNPSLSVDGYGVSALLHGQGAGPASLMLGVVHVDTPLPRPVDEWLPEVVRYVTV